MSLVIFRSQHVYLRLPSPNSARKMPFILILWRDHCTGGVVSVLQMMLLRLREMKYQNLNSGPLICPYTPAALGKTDGVVCVGTIGNIKPLLIALQDRKLPSSCRERFWSWGQTECDP